jgi:hypothetical protein
MKRGGQVFFVDVQGVSSLVTITAVSGTGASGCKRLSLAGDSFTATDVPYRDDAEHGAGYWILVGEDPSPGKVWEREDAQFNETKGR